jgi:hypothetical protein
MSNIIIISAINNDDYKILDTAVRLSELFYQNGHNVTLMGKESVVLYPRITFYAYHDKINFIKTQTTNELINALHRERMSAVPVDLIIYIPSRMDTGRHFLEAFSYFFEIYDSKTGGDVSRKSVKISKDIGYKLREWFPESMLFEFRLFEDFSKEEIVNKAHKLCIECDMNYIIANSMLYLFKDATSYFVDKYNGYINVDATSIQDIFDCIVSLANLIEK